MDLLKIIIDAESLRKTCLLCFNLCDIGTNIDDLIDLQNEYLGIVLRTSMRNIIKYLFPLHDIIFNNACNDCVEDLKKIYCKFHLRDLKIENLKQIVDIINKNIPENIIDTNISIPILGEERFTKNKEVIKYEQNCKKCDMNFTSIKFIKEHNLIKHKNVSQGIICHICGKSCKNPKALKSHVNGHNKKSCPHCQKVLKTHSHYNIHVKSHTMKVKRKRELKYSCDRCPYKTMNTGDLKSHNNKVHLKIRPYQCENCPKSFHKKSNLTAHLLLHNNTRQLICELCGTNFSSKKSLIHHIKLHEGVKDYECEFCKRKFITMSRKNEHIKRNHSNQCLGCPLCSNTYTLKKDLNSHLRRVHNNILLLGENSDNE